MDYQSLYQKTVVELKLLAKVRGIRVPAGLKKTELVQTILEAANQQASESDTTPSASHGCEPSEEKKETPAETVQGKAPAPNLIPCQHPGVRVRNDARQHRIRPRSPETNDANRNTNSNRLPNGRMRSGAVHRVQNAPVKVIRPEAVNNSDARKAAEPVPGTAVTKQETPVVRSVEAPAATVPVPTVQQTVLRSAEPLAAEGVQSAFADTECGEGAGILEIHPDGYGFLRNENYLPGSRDAYVASTQIRRFNLRTGDYVTGKTRPQTTGDRSAGLIFINEVNGMPPESARSRRHFDSLIPVYPDERLRLERRGVTDNALRMIDILAPIGKGQRGLIVSPPKAGKTTLLKKIANAVTANAPEVHLIVLLIDERPEEVTDMKRSIQGEVVYSTFDEAPENHTRVSEMVLERAQRLVELGKDVVILLDSITRLARAYNLVIPPTGRSLSGGLDPGALHKPKRFFGAARNIENGGSLTIIATALVDTGSRMDDIIYEEFKGTGNMELHLDRNLSDRRIFPAIDMVRSGTRREDLLLNAEEMECALSIRRMLSNTGAQETVEYINAQMSRSADNAEFCKRIREYANSYKKDGFKIK